MKTQREKRSHLVVSKEAHEYMHFIKKRLEQEFQGRIKSADFLDFFICMPYEEIKKRYVISFNQKLKKRGLLK